MVQQRQIIINNHLCHTVNAVHSHQLLQLGNLILLFLYTVTNLVNLLVQTVNDILNRLTFGTALHLLIKHTVLRSEIVNLHTNLRNRVIDGL